MKITKNFELAEFLKSPTAEKLKIDNTPRNEYINNIIKLVENIMQPIRDEIGQPIIITSGFRCNILNTAIGGVKTSQHLTGDACDFKIKGGKKAINELFDIIKKMIEEKKKKGWEFIFLAANIDAIETASTYGINKDMAAQYVNDSDGVTANFDALSDAIANVRACSVTGKEWKKKIRK